MVMGDKMDKHETEEQKILRTRETYRYSHSGITASTIWTSSIAHLHCVSLVLPHHVARGSWVGIIPPMEPTIMGSRAGLGEEGGVRVGGMGNRHTEIRVLACWGYPPYPQ